LRISGRDYARCDGLVKPVDGQGWNDGTDLQFLQRFTEYWLNGFDWRAQEKRLNGLPQFMVTVDGQEVHFVHQQGSGPTPLPLILTHGWPGSFAEMEQVIPLLADPQAHGGDPAFRCTCIAHNHFSILDSNAYFVAIQDCKKGFAMMRLSI